MIQIYEIPYTKSKYDTLEKHLYVDEKIDVNNSCFVYFHWNVDTVEAFYFIKDLETRFHININWVNFSKTYLDLIEKKLYPNSFINTIRRELTQRYIFDLFNELNKEEN